MISSFEGCSSLTKLQPHLDKNVSALSLKSHGHVWTEG